METKPIKRTLPVVLTTDERVEFGERLAAAHQNYGSTEIDKKSAADRFKAELDAIDSECSRLARIVRSGEEQREVECTWRYLFETNVKELIRMDTGEIVETTAITAAERQLLLQIDHERTVEAATETK